MEPSTDRVRVLAVPAWLAAHTEPNIEEMVAMLGPETQQLYRRYLADEVRCARAARLYSPCVLAFTRATRELERRNRWRDPDRWPR